MTILLSLWLGFVCFCWGNSYGSHKWRKAYDKCMSAKTFSKPGPKKEPVYLEDQWENS